jgi:hypothetical protein
MPEDAPVTIATLSEKLNCNELMNDPLNEGQF